jgi:hypothetical protein
LDGFHSLGDAVFSDNPTALLKSKLLFYLVTEVFAQSLSGFTPGVL